MDAYATVLVDIKEFEGLFKRESLVLEESYFSILELTILTNVELDHSEEHKVLKLSLFFKLLSLLLFLANLLLSLFLLQSDPLLFSLNLLVDLFSLLLGLTLLLVTLLLSLRRSKVVSGLFGTFSH